MKKKIETKERKAAPLWIRFLSPIMCVVALVAVAIGILSCEREYLWKVQELNLHLDTSLFFRQQMVVPGGILTWLGTYFTEFFYHPVLGVLWLTIWWAALMLLCGKAFRVPLKWSVLLLVPVALLLITCVDLGYWIYYLKLRGHFFVATIALCVVFALVWAFRKIPAKYGLRPLFVVLSTLVLFPFTGFYALLAAVVMGVMSWNLDGTKLRGKCINSVAAVLSVIVVPLVYYHMVYYQTSLENIWWAALPLFCMAEEYGAYYIPYYILVAFCLAMAAGYGKLCSGQVRKPLVWGLANVALLIVLSFGVVKFWYCDYNFHKELRMQHCMELEDWQGLLDEAADQVEPPTRAIVMMRNLALFRLGREGNEMYHYRPGAQPPVTPIHVAMAQVVGSSMYYYYGMPNYCYRWCLEDGVEFGWRAEYLKLLTRCALVNGDHKVARKYLQLLSHTRYHKDWAAEQGKYLDNMQALENDKGYGPVVRLMRYEDRLGSDQAVVEKFLMHHFVTDYSDDKLYIEQSLNAALWTKDIQTFWACFNIYAKSHLNEPMPIHYQEAAYLYGHLEKGVNISNMPFDESVKQSFDAFNKAAENNVRMGLSEEQMKESMYAQFGKTFYYEYYLVRNQKLY